MLTRPEVVRQIHEQYLAAGADIIETNTFGATSIAQDDYGLGDIAREMNVAAARLAREACDKYSTPDKPRFVAGALGPTPRTASISPDVNDPAARNVELRRIARGLPTSRPQGCSKAAATCSWWRPSSTRSMPRRRCSRWTS